MDRIIEMQMMEIHRWNASWITVRGMNRRRGERELHGFETLYHPDPICSGESPPLAFDGFLFETKFTGHVDSAFYAVCCISGFSV